MKRTVICPNCGHVGAPKTHTQGSTFIELILWLCFLIPGLIYSAWRLTSRQKVCRKCGASNLVPTDTPRGGKLLREFGNGAAVVLAMMVFTLMAGCTSMRDFAREHPIVTSVAAAIAIGSVYASQSDDGGTSNALPDIQTPQNPCAATPEACR